MVNPTALFIDEVRRVWGSPGKVAYAGWKEFSRHGDIIYLDHLNQVSYAMRVGVLSGMMANSTPDDFIDAFARILNNK